MTFTIISISTIKHAVVLCGTVGALLLHSAQGATAELEQLLKECEAGNPQSCYLAGKARIEGQSDEKLRQGAANLIRRGCAGDYAPSCAYILENLSSNLFGWEDVVGASTHLKQMCAKGVTEACPAGKKTVLP